MPLGRIDADTTANIGSFSGIGPLNVVCDKVVIKAEARSVSAQKLEAQIEAMRQSCKEATLHLGTTFEFSSQVLYHAYHHSDTVPVVQLAIGAIASLGLSATTCHSGGGSDAHIFNGLGIPTVNLAIGYRDIHTVREHIAVSDLIKATELVVAIVQSAAKSVLHV
jgi:tripeptide aminopeptidase